MKNDLWEQGNTIECKKTWFTKLSIKLKRILNGTVVGCMVRKSEKALKSGSDVKSRKFMTSHYEYSSAVSQWSNAVVSVIGSGIGRQDVEKASK